MIKKSGCYSYLIASFNIYLNQNVSTNHNNSTLPLFFNFY